MYNLGFYKEITLTKTTHLERKTLSKYVQLFNEESITYIIYTYKQE